MTIDKLFEFITLPFSIILIVLIWASMEIIIKSRKPHLGIKLSLLLFRLSAGFVIISSIVMPPYVNDVNNVSYGLPFGYIKLYTNYKIQTGFFSLFRTWSNTVITNWSFNHLSYLFSVIVIFIPIYYFVKLISMKITD